MALTIRNQEVERLAEEVARLAGETKTEAIRKALEMRLKELERKRRFDRVLRFLEEEVWPQIPPELRGKGIRKEELEEILGYGPEGY
ncbi:type II toxin-antitoxin system VapB family antitoxin [Thermus sediminis]|uniref:type II toxin-antitoxin system VapB family antitoxin n=1 Tax=Thermus sediminis TaxID=1761908 RepID=UPI000E3D8351|nr:type II toxin-antitoxin system VapB family antitoxin [Thermus sediminis]